MPTDRSQQAQPHPVGVGQVRVHERVGPLEVSFRHDPVGEVDPRCVAPGERERRVQAVKDRVVTRSTQGGEVVVPIDGRDDEPHLASGHELAVHHQARHAAVAVREGMDLRGQEHQVGSSGKRSADGSADVEPRSQGAYHLVRRHEVGRAGTVGDGLELAGPLDPVGLPSPLDAARAAAGISPSASRGTRAIAVGSDVMR